MHDRTMDAFSVVRSIMLPFLSCEADEAHMRMKIFPVMPMLKSSQMIIADDEINLAVKTVIIEEMTDSIGCIAHPFFPAFIIGDNDLKIIIRIFFPVVISKKRYHCESVIKGCRMAFLLEVRYACRNHNEG